MDNVIKLQGKVEYGHQIGRDIGFPTANIPLPRSFPHPFGVYLAKVHIEAQTFYSLVSIGSRPTIASGQKPNVECFLLDFEGEIYGHTIQVELLKYMRAELKFDSIEDLKAQINQDILTARKIIDTY